MSLFAVQSWRRCREHHGSLTLIKDDEYSFYVSQPSNAMSKSELSKELFQIQCRLHAIHLSKEWAIVKGITSAFLCVCYMCCRGFYTRSVVLVWLVDCLAAVPRAPNVAKNWGLRFTSKETSMKTINTVKEVAKTLDQFVVDRNVDCFANRRGV